jgi:hypothetical protein
MPELILTLANRKILEEGCVSLHQCVKYTSFIEKRGLLNFIPPGKSLSYYRWKFYFNGLQVNYFLVILVWI